MGIIPLTGLFRLRAEPSLMRKRARRATEQPASSSTTPVAQPAHPESITHHYQERGDGEGRRLHRRCWVVMVMRRLMTFIWTTEGRDRAGDRPQARSPRARRARAHG